jgi:hypothetical protein
VAGSCEHDNEPLYFMKGNEFVTSCATLRFSGKTSTTLITQTAGSFPLKSLYHQSMRKKCLTYLEMYVSIKWASIHTYTCLCLCSCRR